MSDFRAKTTGNFINSLLALAGRMREENFEPIFMFPKYDDGSVMEWIDYIRCYPEDSSYEVILFDKSKTNEEIANFLFELIDKYKITLIYSHFSCCDRVLLWNKKMHSKVKILYHDHMDYVAEIPAKVQFKKQVKLAKRYREYGIGVISVMKRKHRGYFLTPNRWYIPNAITFKRNVSYSMTREECRKYLNLNDKQKLCLFLGWDIYRKGLDIAIKAVTEARKTDPNIVLGVLGFEDNVSQEDVERIEKVIGFSPLREGVRFLKTEEDMYAIYRASDALLSASRTEAFSYAILEAISQNVPIVVSDIPGTKWSWKYSKCIKFKNEDVKDCADSMLKAVSMRDLPSNSDAVIQNYNIDDWCNKVIRVCKKFLK